MFLRCPCGHTLTDTAAPGRIAHTLLSAHGVERLQNAVDAQVAAAGVVDGWPEHFEAARATEVWLCPACGRLFVGVSAAGVGRVYSPEGTDLPRGSTGLDSQLDPAPDWDALAREQAGESPLTSQQPERVPQPPTEPTIPRPCSLVRFQFDLLPAESHTLYPFTPDGVYVFLGDIPNMPGHCVVADHRTGRVYSGYHTEGFAEVPGDE